jgi:hypothetical protein
MWHVQALHAFFDPDQRAASMGWAPLSVPMLAAFCERYHMPFGFRFGVNGILVLPASDAVLAPALARAEPLDEPVGAMAAPLSLSSSPVATTGAVATSSTHVGLMSKSALCSEVNILTDPLVFSGQRSDSAGVSTTTTEQPNVTPAGLDEDGDSFLLVTACGDPNAVSRAASWV